MGLRVFVLFLAVACLATAAPSLSSREDSSEESTTPSYAGKVPTTFVTPVTHRARRDTTGSEAAPDRRPLTKPSPPESQPQHSTSTQHKRDTTGSEPAPDRRPLTKPSPPESQPEQTTSTQHKRDTTGSEPAPDRRPLTKPSPPESQPQHSTSTQHKRSAEETARPDHSQLTRPAQPAGSASQPGQAHTFDIKHQTKRDTTSHEADRHTLTKPSPAQTGTQPQHSTTQHKRSAEETARPDHSQLTRPAQPAGSASQPGQAHTFDIKHQNKRETATKEENPQSGPSVQPALPSPPQHDDTFDIKRKQKRETPTKEEKPQSGPSVQPVHPSPPQHDDTFDIKRKQKRDTSSEEHVDRRPLTKPSSVPSNSQPEPSTNTEHKRETAEKKPQTNPPVVSTLPARPVDAAKPQH